MIRTVLIDDQPLMRSALRTILRAGGIEVAGEAGNAIDGVAMVRNVRPEVVLMDVRMPGRDGIDATAELVATAPECRVLILTTFDDDAAIDGALRAGASGFLLKNSAPEEVVKAVNAIVAGEGVLDPAVVARVMRRYATGSAADRRGTSPEIESLTDREREALDLLCRGCANVEIAERLGVGEATAKTHVSRVLEKLGVRDRVQAVIHAYDCGFAGR